MRPLASDTLDRRLLDVLPVGVAIYELDDPGDPATLRIRYANPASATVAGVDLRARTGERLAEVAPVATEAGLLRLYADVLRSGQPRDLGAEGDPTGSGAAVRAIPLDDGALAVVSESASEGAQALQDAQADLAREENRSRTLLDAIGDVVLVYPIGPEGPGTFLVFNDAAVNRYGYSPDELRAMTVHDLIDSDRFDAEGALTELRRTRRATFDSVHRTKSGDRLYMSTHARLVELAGKLCVVALCRDDADRRQFRRSIARSNRQLEASVAQRTRQLEAFSEDLKILHAITTAEHDSPADRFDAYLRAGCEMFDLPVGILSATPVDEVTGERMYRLEAVVSPDPGFHPGLTVPLSEAFCDAVVDLGHTVTYGDAQEQAPDHPACVARGLRAFIGTPVTVDGALFGTLNFVSPEPRPEGFSDVERDLIEVMAQAVGRRIEADRAEAAEAASRERYRAIVETVDAGVIVVDTNFEVVMSNPSAREFLGLDVAHDAETDDLPDRWPVLDADGTPLTPADLPEREVLRTGEPVRGLVQGIVPPGKPVRWYRVNATPLDHDGDGTPEAVVVSFHDVTDLRATALAAERSEDLLRAVLSASAEGVMAYRAVRDGDGAVEDFEWLLVTDRAAEIVGRDADDLVGRQLLEEFPEVAETDVFEAYIRVVDEGERFEGPTPDVEVLDRPWWIRAVPLRAVDGLAMRFVPLDEAGS
ncbi:hypothetical protein BSZ37_10160 [Rubrivirga marina]|uniref:PAS domain-containing protein n=1 Tax=Rubrivirga marina TaxID=1196024 RepID=A0A271IZV3_9BACT|nr:hypothetical protein BSZ37_10160 [Rubrivirga marina]